MTPTLLLFLGILTGSIIMLFVYKKLSTTLYDEENKAKKTCSFYLKLFKFSAIISFFIIILEIFKITHP